MPRFEGGSGYVSLSVLWTFEQRNGWVSLDRIHNSTTGQRELEFWDHIQNANQLL